MATDRIINQTQGDEIIAGLLAIKNAITNQPVPTTVEDVVAPVFDDGVSYTVGEFVMHEGLLYKCTTAHHGAWDGSDFTLTTMGDQVSDLNEALSDKLNFTYTPLLEVSSTVTSISIAQNINNFKLVALMFKTAGDVYINYAMIPVAAFKTGGIQVDFYDTSRHYAVVKYKSDTTVNTQFSGGTVYGEFYGIL